MTIRKKALIIGTAAIIAGSSLGALPAFAADAQPQQHKNIFEIIAEKFNLKKEDVQKVVQDHRKEMLTQRLDKAVQDGKLTKDQETKILQKFDEEQGFRDSLQNMSQDQRKDALKKHKAEIEQWAKDNNIPLQYLLPHQHRGGMRPPKDGQNSQNQGQQQSDNHMNDMPMGQLQ